MRWIASCRLSGPTCHPAGLHPRHRHCMTPETKSNPVDTQLRCQNSQLSQLLRRPMQEAVKVMVEEVPGRLYPRHRNCMTPETKSSPVDTQLRCQNSQLSQLLRRPMQEAVKVMAEEVVRD